MAKPKKKKATPEDLIKDIDEQIESDKLTEEEKNALRELKEMIIKGIENGDFAKKKLTFKGFLLNVCKILCEFSISFLFVLVMFGFTFQSLKETSYLPLMIAGLSISLGFVITGSTDYIRFLYDKLYLGIKIMLVILKYFTFAIINSFVFKLYDPMIVLFITVLVSDLAASHISRKLLR